MMQKLLISFLLVCFLESCGGSSGANSASQSSNSVATTSTSASSSSLAPGSSSSTSKASSSSSITQTKTFLSYGNNSMQVGELRLPQTVDNSPLPLVIIIHGGCWVSSYASYHFMDDFAHAVTNLGYATWNIEYRALGTGGDWPVIFQDVSKAVDYARTLAQTYPININKVAVIGHSAGGHLALWSASRKNIKNESELYVENPLAIRGVISVAGIANVTGNNSCTTLANNVIGVPIAPLSNNLMQRLLETSPLQMLPINTKTILISGSTDGIVPSSMGTEYSNEAIKQGDDSVHYNLQGLGHFDLIDPNKTNWALYQQSLQQIFKD